MCKPSGRDCCVLSSENECERWRDFSFIRDCRRYGENHPYQNGSIEDPDTPPTPEAKLLKGIGNKVAFKYDSDGHIIAFSQEWYSNGVHSSTVEVVIKWTNGNIANYESVVYRPDGTIYSQEIGIPYIYSYY